MKYEDILLCILDKDVFQARCKEVCEILTRLDSSYAYLDRFELIENEVWGEGEDDDIYCGEYDKYSEKFPIDFLWKDDEEINRYVEDELNKRKKYEESKRLEIQKILKEVQERQDRAEYERLKKKFG